jgi:hypothetical protein
MNLAEFNNNFPSFEATYKAEQQVKQQIQKENDLSIRKKIFEKTYPNLSFNDLKEQSDNWSTDDSCIHYKHTNGNIFSFNYEENYWETSSDKFSDLDDMF